MIMRQRASGSPEMNQHSNMTFNASNMQRPKGSTGSPGMEPNSTSDFFNARNNGQNGGRDDMESAFFASRSVTQGSPDIGNPRGRLSEAEARNKYQDMYTTTYNQTKRKLPTFSGDSQAVLDSSYSKLKEVEDFRSQNNLKEKNAFDSMADQYNREDGTYDGFDYLKARYYYELENPPSPDRSRSASPISQGRSSFDPSKRGQEGDPYGIKVSPADDNFDSPVLNYTSWQTTTTTKRTLKSTQGSPDQYRRPANDPTNTSFGAWNNENDKNGQNNMYSTTNTNVNVTKNVVNGQRGAAMGPNEGFGGANRDGQGQSGNFGTAGDGFNNSWQNNDITLGDGDQVPLNGFNQVRGIRRGDPEADNTGQRRPVGNFANNTQSEKTEEEQLRIKQIELEERRIKAEQESIKLKEAQIELEMRKIQEERNRIAAQANEVERLRREAEQLKRSSQDQTQANAKTVARSNSEIDYQAMDRLEAQMKNVQSDIKAKELEAEMLDKLNDAEVERRNIIAQQLAYKQEMIKAEAERKKKEAMDREREEEMRRVAEEALRQQANSQELSKNIVEIDSRMRKSHDQLMHAQEEEREAREKSISALEKRILSKIQEVLDAQKNTEIENVMKQRLTEADEQATKSEMPNKTSSVTQDTKITRTNINITNKTTSPSTPNRSETPTFKKKVIVHAESKDVSDDTKDVFVQMADGRLGKIVSTREYTNRSDSPIPKIQTQASPVTRAQTSNSPAPRVVTVESANYSPAKGYNTAYQSTHSTCHALHIQGGAHHCCHHVCQLCGCGSIGYGNGPMSYSTNPHYSTIRPSYRGTSPTPGAFNSGSNTERNLGGTIPSGLNKMVVSTAPLSTSPITIKSTTPPSKIGQVTSPSGPYYSQSSQPTQMGPTTAGAYRPAQVQQLPNSQRTQVSHQQAASYSRQQYQPSTVGSSAAGRSVSPIVNKNPVDNPMTLTDILNEANKNFESFKPQSQRVSQTRQAS